MLTVNRHSANLHSHLKPKSFAETLRLGGLWYYGHGTPATRHPPASRHLMNIFTH
ncbi:uncharacterized protein G2W53_009662 [Senna tora]|uniref:Uncharacterized protein n=1 Tax=Senna tora TaxID=362788 RepID=A0A834WYK7_9FABA|nr:uncharacterized protein G2W53_009662 [Senna tora]